MKTFSNYLDGPLFVVAVSILSMGAFFWGAMPEDEPEPEPKIQYDVRCFSGGHMVFADMSEDIVTGNAHTRGTTTDGYVFAITESCVIIDSGYYEDE